MREIVFQDGCPRVPSTMYPAIRSHGTVEALPGCWGGDILLLSTLQPGEKVFCLSWAQTAQGRWQKGAECRAPRGKEPPSRPCFCRAGHQLALWQDRGSVPTTCEVVLGLMTQCHLSWAGRLPPALRAAKHPLRSLGSAAKVEGRLPRAVGGSHVIRVWGDVHMQPLFLYSFSGMEFTYQVTHPFTMHNLIVEGTLTVVCNCDHCQCQC